MRLLSRLCLFILLWLSSSASFAKAPARYYYHLKIYQLQSTAQQQRVEKFLESAYVPALHRAGINSVGVFKTMETDSVKRIYVLIPYKELKQIDAIAKTLEKDDQYLSSGKDYLQAAHNDQPYQRIETVLLQAFEGMPMPFVPKLTGPKEQRVYELRSYESPTEKYFANKVQMFNKGEIDIFHRLGFNAVFYAEAIAGSQQPNLVYMTSFTNKASRDEHWKMFGDDAAWKKLSAMPEYQNNVSKIHIYFLYPAGCSDF
ncbi:NIPSNAP family protein [Terrimonas sp. NA20]|uniref:NIPSNAP family protein n=1 Tax=Terrimonas ginsenosidimutans TaxID=2908004 RepID=A0ABS9KKG8_9BACT|nr:NIPSNAP family protein [Terrimonas ginsenosidimutans]MCG2612818.1 NIPSNAP family protein [Terrimonas ginsenosidimutans]